MAQAGSDYFFNEKLIIPYDTMLQWVSDIFGSYGMREEDARLSADTLVNADARGVYSHGCMRTTVYCHRFDEGGNDPLARPEIVRRKGAIAMVNGNNAMGQIVSVYATKLGVEIAKEFGTASISVKCSNHLGACAYYCNIAAEEDCISFCGTVNGVNIMAPWGGRERQLGNNPFGVGVPCLTKPPVILDMAQSVVARGKIVMARKTHAPIPETWALGRDGMPTTDPDEGYLGTVRPVGDYKGSGLAFMNAIIAGILPNASFGPTVSDLYELPAIVQDTGHFFQIIDIGAFDEPTAFKKRMDDAVNYIKSGEKTDGVEEIFVPDEINARKLAYQREHGIEYAAVIIEELRELSKKRGVPPLA